MNNINVLTGGCLVEATRLGCNRSERRALVAAASRRVQSGVVISTLVISILAISTRFWWEWNVFPMCPVITKSGLVISTIPISTQSGR